MGRLRTVPHDFFNGMMRICPCQAAYLEAGIAHNIPWQWHQSSFMTRHARTFDFLDVSSDLMMWWYHTNCVISRKSLRYCMRTAKYQWMLINWITVKNRLYEHAMPCLPAAPKCTMSRLFLLESERVVYPGWHCSCWCHPSCRELRRIARFRPIMNQCSTFFFLIWPKFGKQITRINCCDKMLDKNGYQYAYQWCHWQ